MTISEDAFAFNKQANRFAQKGQIQEAFEAYKRALEYDPEFIEAWGNLGILLTRTGQMEEAEGCFEAAFALDPEYPFTWGAWAGYLVIQDRMKEAEQALQKALQLDPDNPKIWAIFGMLFMESDSKQAEDAFRHALEIDPDNEKLVYGYGIILNYAGRHSEAEELAHRAVKANKDYADAWELLAQACYCQSNLKGAINAQLAAAKLKETDHKCLFNLGILYSEAGFLREARDVLRCVVSMSPDFITAWELLINVLKESGNEGDLREVQSMFDDLLRANPDFEKGEDGYLTRKEGTGQ
jgi:tetratricopeptide (TPR) repeat protein